MVKFSNRGRGKTSKRMTLKKKFKIERKVKQYRKKLKKEAKNLKSTGIKHKSISSFTQKIHRKTYYPTCFHSSSKCFNKLGTAFLNNPRLPSKLSTQLSSDSLPWKINQFTSQKQGTTSLKNI